MFDFIKNFIIDTAGAAVGYLEMIGLKYPVKKYSEEVSPNLWRGSRVGPDEIKALKDKGFKLIVNLCKENDNDTKPGQQFGIGTLHIPIYDNQAPTLAQMVAFLHAVNQSENQPAYVHCEAGRGRTGVAVACYRIALQKWAVDKAVEEAKAKGMAIQEQEEFLRETFGPKLANGSLNF